MRSRLPKLRIWPLHSWIVLVLIASVPGPVIAQEGTGCESLDNRECEAIRLVEAGELAAQGGRWADAVDAFRRAYEIRPAAAILFNLAFALRALGQYREARDGLEELLGEYPNALPVIRENAQTLLQEVTTRVGTLIITGLDTNETLTLRLDGAVIEDTGERPFRIDVNPGARNLQVSQDGFLPFRWRRDVEPGDEVRIAAVLLEQEVLEESPSFTSRPAFWIILGVVAVAAGGVSWYLLDQSAQLEPAPGRPHVTLLSSH